MLVTDLINFTRPKKIKDIWVNHFLITLQNEPMVIGHWFIGGFDKLPRVSFSNFIIKFKTVFWL